MNAKEKNTIQAVSLKEGCKRFSEEQIFANHALTENAWVHMLTSSKEGKQLISEQEEIEPWIVDSLFAKKVRPRISIGKHGILVILRVSDRLKGKFAEELRSLRLYITETRILSTSLIELPLVTSLMEKITNRGVPISPYDLLLKIMTKVINSLEELIEQIDEQTDMAEKQVLSDGPDPSKVEMANLAMGALELRRYLAPQKDVFLRLINLDFKWLHKDRLRAVKEISDKVMRQLEEVELIRERVRVIREEINLHIGEDVNYRLYVFSVIAVFFLPLGFLTGLFGINVGGIPFAENPHGFLIFCLGLFGLTGGLTLLFKRWEWI